MSRPLRQIIQDMRGIHNRALSRLRLPLKEGEEVAPREQVQVDCDFVQ